MSTQRNATIRRNTAAVMAVLNLLLVFLVFAGVHRLETALYSRCQERVAFDAAQVEAWRAVMLEAPSAAQREAAKAVVDAQVKSSCRRLRLLGLGR